MINYKQLRAQSRNKRHILGLLPCNTREDHRFNACVLLGCILLAALMLIFSCRPAHAQDYTDEQYVNAIYKAEGRKNAQYPYGIRSIPCSDEKSCRKICLNTVRNNRKRYEKSDRSVSFTEFLAGRYAPVGVSNDPHRLNRNWIKNVTYFLNKESA